MSKRMFFFSVPPSNFAIRVVMEENFTPISQLKFRIYPIECKVICEVLILFQFLIFFWWILVTIHFKWKKATHSSYFTPFYHMCTPLLPFLWSIHHHIYVYTWMKLSILLTVKIMQFFLISKIWRFLLSPVIHSNTWLKYCL